MDILHLTYFVEVAKHKSFTKAAQALHISQPSISKMIRNLEDELGLALFYRSSKHVELTDAGNAVFARAQEIVTSLHTLSQELGDISTIKKGQLTIGIPPMVVAHFFALAIGEFKRSYPSIDIHLKEVGSKQVELGVEDGSLDIGVVVLPVKNPTLWDMFIFIKDPIMLIVHADHPLAQQSIVHITDLKHQSLVLFREDFALHDHIIDKCIEHGFKPTVLCESSQWDFMVEIVTANLGVALLPKKVSDKLDPYLVKALYLAEPINPWHLAVIWKKGKYLSFAAREWLKFTSSLFGIKIKLP